MYSYLPDYIIESRGVVVLFEEPYNPKAMAVAAKHNMIMPNNRAKQLAEEDFSYDCLVLTMEESIRDRIYAEYNNAINVYVLSEFAGMPECKISDPYGKSAVEYNKCFEDICMLVEKAAKRIERMQSEAAKGED